MSIRAINWANEKAQRQASSGAQLVLITLADFADEEGLCWPGIATLAERSIQSARTVLRQIAEMERDGLLKRQSRMRPDGTRSTNAYYLQFERVVVQPGDNLSPGSPCDNLSYGQPCDTKPENQAQTQAGRAADQNAQVAALGGDHVTKTPHPCDTAMSQQEPPEEPPKNNKTSLGLHDAAATAAPPPPKLRKVSFAPEDRKLAEWMLERIRDVHAGFRTPNLDAWANDLRLLREREHRTHREIARLFAWANADTFWRANILSPSKLREQWDKLAIKRDAGQTQGGRQAAMAPPTPRQRQQCCFVATDGAQCQAEGAIVVNGAGCFCHEHRHAAYR